MGKAYHQDGAKDTMAQIQHCLDCKRKECTNCIHSAQNAIYDKEYHQRKKANQNECLRSKT